MRILVAVMVVFAVGLVASPASAQEETKQKFYDFDDMLVDGDIRVPDGMLEQAREQAKFKRLLSLKKSFLPKVQATSEESALQ